MSIQIQHPIYRDDDYTRWDILIEIRNDTTPHHPCSAVVEGALLCAGQDRHTRDHRRYVTDDPEWQERNIGQCVPTVEDAIHQIHEALRRDLVGLAIEGEKVLNRTAGEALLLSGKGAAPVRTVTPSTFVATRAAQVAHEVLRAYRGVIGDNGQDPWSQLEPWRRDSLVQGAELALSGATPEHQHETWLENRQRAGWTYGDVEDAVAKTHPAMVPYDMLPMPQRVKGALFQAAVRAVAGTL